MVATVIEPATDQRERATDQGEGASDQGEGTSDQREGTNDQREGASDQGEGASNERVGTKPTLEDGGVTTVDERESAATDSQHSVSATDPAAQTAGQ